MRALAILALVSACSEIVMRAPEPGERGPQVDCLESQVPPWLDILGASFAVAFAIRAEDQFGGTRDGDAIAAGFAAGAVVYGASSWLGFRDGARCRLAHAIAR